MFDRTPLGLALLVFASSPFLLAAAERAPPLHSSASLYHAFSRMEAESGKLAPGLRTAGPANGERFLDGFADGRWVGFPRVIFDAGASGAEARVLVEGSPARLTVRLGTPEGPTIGAFELSPSDHWQTLGAEIWRITGLQPVYLVYEGEGSLRLDWIRFLHEAPTPTGSPPDEAPMTTARENASPAADQPDDAPAWVVLEAEEARHSRDLRIREDPDGTRYLSPIRSRSWVMYPQVTYGEDVRLRLRVAGHHVGDLVEVRLGSRHSQPVASARLRASANFSEWQLLEIELPKIEPGRYDTYLAFIDGDERLYSGVPGSLLDPARSARSTRTLAYLDWLAVSSSPLPEEPALAASR
jgi:hypothetical protein